jgi:hypothetical protein
VVTPTHTRLQPILAAAMVIVPVESVTRHPRGGLLPRPVGTARASTHAENRALQWEALPSTPGGLTRRRWAGSVTACPRCCGSSATHATPLHRHRRRSSRAAAVATWGFLPKATERYIPGLELSESESLGKLCLPLLRVFFDDMRVGEIQINGSGGQPVMPEDFLKRRQ